MQFKKLIALAPFLAVAVAAPLKTKRDLVYHTVIDEVVVTEVLTTTIWVNGPGQAPPAKPTVASVPVESPAPAPAIPSPVSPPAASPPAASPPAASPPAPSSSTTGFVGVQQPTSVPTPTTTSTPVAAPSSSPSSPSSNPAPAGSFAVSTLAGASNPDGPCTPEQTCTGDMTFYSPSQGVGACGFKDWTSQTIYTDNDMVVAIPHQIFGTTTNGGTPDSMNTLCNRSVHIYNPHSGISQVAKVVDKCGGCLSAYDIDMSPALFNALGGGDGRVHGIEWYWTN
jgi:hypothetical protein